MEKAARIAAFRFQRVSECVAEIEQRACAGRLTLIRGDDARLRLDRASDGLGAQGFVAGQQGRAIRLAPFEEGGIVDQPVFHHLGIACAQLARGQGGKRADIGQHQRGLVERADQVLACARVDRGLAADAGIDLRQQRGGKLDEAAAALEHRGGETGQIADHPAAKGQYVIAPVDPFGQQEVAQLFQMRPVLGRFARGQHQPARLFPVSRQRGVDRVAPQRRDMGIGDDGHGLLAQQRAALCGDVGQQAAAHAHIIAAARQRDGHGFSGHAR